MKGFIETSYVFDAGPDLRAKMLTVTKRQMLQYKDKFLNILTKDMEPENRQAELELLIADLRPDLAGCRVFAFQYEMCSQLWRIGVVHESFPLSDVNCELESEPLVKESAPNRSGMWMGEALPSHIEMKNGFGLKFFKTNLTPASVTDIQREQLEDPDPPEEKTWRDQQPLL